jgi:iron(III) transport system substrate-binding protein
MNKVRVRNGRKWMIFITVVIALCILSACSGGQSTKPAQAPASSPTMAPQQTASAPKELKTAQDVALYEAADRNERILEAAKKEGKLTVYTSMAAEDMQMLSEIFEQKYGIKVTTYRASSEDVLQRVVQESRAKRYDADIVETNGPEMEAIFRENLLQEVKSPFFKDLIPEAILPHKQWVATRLNIFVQAYNTTKVKKEELPKTWEDLLDPKWKGRIGIEGSDQDWYAAVVKDLGEDKGTKLFKDIAAKNGFSVRKGHTLLTQLVASGEVPFALTVYNYKAQQLKTQGAPVDWFAVEPAYARPNGVGMLRNSTHPNAAMLFYDFMITDAQQKLLDKEFVPTSKLIKTPLTDLKMKFIDPAITLDEKSKWDKLFTDMLKTK